MGNVSLMDVIKPYETQQVWDIYLYIILLFQLLLLVLLFNGSLSNVIMIAIAILCAVMDKLYIWGFYDPGLVNAVPHCSDIADGAAALKCAVNFHTTTSFMTFLIRLLMFVMPVFVTTLAKVPKKNKAPVISLLLAGMTIIYVGGRLFAQQSGIL